jgi:hypothetical protein
MVVGSGSYSIVEAFSCTHEALLSTRSSDV